MAARIKSNMQDALLLKYACGGMAVYAAGDVFGPRKLTDFELVWILSGDCRYRYNGQDLPAPPHSIMLARPGFYDAFVWDKHQATHHAYIHFDVQQYPSDWPDLAKWPVIIRPQPQDSLFLLLRQIMDHWARQATAASHIPPPWVHRLIGSLIENFFLYAQHHTSPRQSQSPYAPVIHRSLLWMIHQVTTQPDKPMHLSQIAEAACVSEVHLCRQFQKEIGLSPMRLIQLLKMDQAMALLERSNYNVSQIAEKLGYANPYHFSRCFKQAYGLAPRFARQKILASQPRPTSALNHLPHIMAMAWS